MLRDCSSFAFKLTVISLILIVGAWAATEKVLWNFVANPQGETPMSGLISDAAGNLYGTTQRGGLHNWGTVFELTPRTNGGWTESVLYSFPNGGSGALPSAGVVMDGTGNLYGTTLAGGFTGSTNCQSSGGCGTVFELSPTSSGTWQYKLLHQFQATDGAAPAAALTLDASGNLYGTTPYGGTPGGGSCCGVVFELSRTVGNDWNETVLYSFPCISGCAQGGEPSSGVIFDQAGNLYGVTDEGFFAGGNVFELSPGSGGQWTETTLYSFCAQGGEYCPDGAAPRGTLIFDQAGNLYGTTLEGGTRKAGGGGVVFELTHGSGGTWSESVLFAFHGGKEGYGPSGGVVFDAAGNLYGTTVEEGEGGATCQQFYNVGCGMVFELSPASGSWTETIVHNFRSTDGAGPSTGVLIDRSGNLYGTTPSFGYLSNTNGGGTVFKLSPSGAGWQETTYYFRATDGENPSSGVISDAKGNLYGTAGGGTYGNGVVFELSPNSHGGVRRTILYNFKGGTDGAGPEFLTFDGAGNLYGVTFEGGMGDNVGTVFELSPGADGKWSEKILHVFSDLNGDGFYPLGSVVFDAAGNLYGATYEGGTNGGCGTIYELSPSSGGSWAETILHSFSGENSDGCDPWAGVVLDSFGNVYGTTAAGGSLANGGSGYGTVFELSLGSGGVWTENQLYVFDGSDGSEPAAALTFDQMGNLYGTTSLGGSGGCYEGCGLVFELSPSTSGQWDETVIGNFGDDNLADPGPVVFDAHGNLYGTTTPSESSLCPPLCGAVFELEPKAGGNWKENTIFNFEAGRQGTYPNGPVTLDAAGNLYATAREGGPADEGLVFVLRP